MHTRDLELLELNPWVGNTLIEAMHMLTYCTGHTRCSLKETFRYLLQVKRLSIQICLEKSSLVEVVTTALFGLGLSASVR